MTSRGKPLVVVESSRALILDREVVTDKIEYQILFVPKRFRNKNLTKS